MIRTHDTLALKKKKCLSLNFEKKNEKTEKKNRCDELCYYIAMLSTKL